MELMLWGSHGMETGVMGLQREWNKLCGIPAATELYLYFYSAQPSNTADQKQSNQFNKGQS